jgi:hypothetical protein
VLNSLVFVVYALQAKGFDCFCFRGAAFGFYTLNEGLIFEGNLLTHKASKSSSNFNILWSIWEANSVFLI